MGGRLTKLVEFLKLFQALIVFIVFLLVVGGAYAAYNHQTNEELRRIALSLQIFRDCDYAVQLHMRAVADPEVSSWMGYPDFDMYPNEYTRVEYVMEFPPAGEMEYGVIYFAPTPDYPFDRTLNLNCIVSMRPELLDGTGLAMPLTVEDVVCRADAVKGMIAKFEYHEEEYFRYGYIKFSYDSAPDGWREAVAQVRASLSPADAVEAEAGDAGFAADAAD
jgi:hypothetical protein